MYRFSQIWAAYIHYRKMILFRQQINFVTIPVTALLGILRHSDELTVDVTFW